ncbi:FkbM family methyltransferase, partial [Eubacteriales bacterium OttesenSCG-928-A19]|nr:FkbM family methyltransferase [Eubacteriales bacterium OttesenSCG-928-A19]
KQIDNKAIQAVEKIESVKNEIEVIEEVSPKKILFDDDYDRKFVYDFQQYRKRPEYEADFLNLISGLDAPSREMVVRILRRVDLVEGTEGESLDIFTPEEQSILRDRQRRIKEIYKVSEECYCFEQYMLPVNNFAMSVFMDAHGLCCVNDVNMRRIQNEDIIDAGGFIGDSLLILSPLTNKKVYSFEAVGDHLSLMQKTIALNGIQNAVPVKAGLSNKKEKLEIFRYGRGSSFGNIITQDNIPIKTTEMVQCVTLDEYASENNLQVGLIKVDIEGFEQQFLEGAKKIIFQQRPIMLLSIYHNAEDFFKIKPLIESWKLGYKFKIYKGIDQRISVDTILVVQP